MAKSYVKYETPDDVRKAALEAVQAGRGGLRKGTNETTKAIERGEAKLVVIAEDVDPEEIVMHLPVLCTEKRIPFAYAKDKKTLGEAAGLHVGTAAVAVTKGGEEHVKAIAQKIAGMVKSEAKTG
ncbi:MAG: 50S ribosomal protein L7Ae [Candidatus Micrarchaeota archaeon]|nr:50S ribosomal protein L7Ae [Candidatus Micrarchaeota archaeon]